ncbi:MAG: ethanolamine ammonia-lyase subunit EutC [bacterium]
MNEIKNHNGELLFSRMKEMTSARIAIGRSGGSLTTREILDFDEAHARARDAVWTEFKPEMMMDELGRMDSLNEMKLEILGLNSAAKDRATYLKRPDLGRRLDHDSTEIIKQLTKRPDLVIIISDGLSSQATMQQTPAFLKYFISLFKDCSIVPGPILVIPKARVGISNSVGALTGARGVAILLGERPGLSAPESLGVYYTYMPGPGSTDADRNCISNIHAQGLSPQDAAIMLFGIVQKSFLFQTGGVALSQSIAQNLV